MRDIQDWLDQSRALEEARAYAPFTAKPDEWGDKIVLKSSGYSLRTGDWGDNDTIQPTPNTEYVNHAIQAFPKALDALQAVLDMHHDDGDGLCNECSDGLLSNDPCPTVASYPCPTVRAIQTAVKGQDAWTRPRTHNHKNV